MAHELHDGPVQVVASVSLELDGLARALRTGASPSPEHAAGELDRLRSITQQAAAELRGIVRRLSEAHVAEATMNGSRDAVTGPGRVEQ